MKLKLLRLYSSLMKCFVHLFVKKVILVVLIIIIERFSVLRWEEKNRMNIRISVYKVKGKVENFGKVSNAAKSKIKQEVL